MTTTDTRSHDRDTTHSRDHNITRSQTTDQEESPIMNQWRPVLIDGTTPTAIDTGRTLGTDGTPVLFMVDEYAELCARHADALAGEAESIARDVMAQVDELSHGNLLAGVRRAFGFHGSLRRLSGQLGELHTVLDELAHHAARRPGGA